MFRIVWLALLRLLTSNNTNILLLFSMLLLFVLMLLKLLCCKNMGIIDIVYAFGMFMLRVYAQCKAIELMDLNMQFIKGFYL